MSRIHCDMAGASDIGCTRLENQDHFLIAELRRQLIIRNTDIPDGECDELFGCREGSLLVVADGMGGHTGGEIASRTAVKATARYVLDMTKWFLKLSPDDEQDFIDELSGSLGIIQKRIWSQSDSSSRSMGTTVTMSYILWPRMYVVHAGDSRCYLFRDGRLEQLTTDHTVVQQMLNSGAITHEEAAVSKWRNVLWNCVGGGDPKVRPEVVLCRLQIGDTVLLCSDGLNGMVRDDFIAKVLSKNGPSSACVDELIQGAKQAGGKDNISVVVCHVLGEIADDCNEQGSTDTTVVEEVDSA